MPVQAKSIQLIFTSLITVRMEDVISLAVERLVMINTSMVIARSAWRSGRPFFSSPIPSHTLSVVSAFD